MQNWLPCRPLYQIFQQSIRCHGTQSESYYDILKVKKDCTTQEIRNAYVQLSKEHHPDMKGGVNADPKFAANFVKIAEAYKTLSKPSSRSLYDQQLWDREISNAMEANGMASTNLHRPWEIRPNYNPKPGSYYGVHGLKKQTNSKIAIIITAICIICTLLGFLSVKHTFNFQRKLLDEKSAAASSHHANIRADAQKYGNEEQLKRMLNRMLKHER